VFNPGALAITARPIIVTVSSQTIYAMTQPAPFTMTVTGGSYAPGDAIASLGTPTFTFNPGLGSPLAGGTYVVGAIGLANPD